MSDVRAPDDVRVLVRGTLDLAIVHLGVLQELEPLLRTTAMGAHAYPNLSHVFAYVLERMLDGLRRPGSWERGWLEQAFGAIPPKDEGPKL